MRKGLLTASMLLGPRSALACPVCFGQSDSPMASAANMSILVMLVITVAVLAGFASFFIYLIRQARIAGAGPQMSRAETTGAYPSTPREGTAQC